MPIHDLLLEFPICRSVIYLNYAGVSPWPRRTAEAIKRFAEENVTLGPIHYDQWSRREAQLRDRLRDLIHAPSSDDIALLKNTSEALSVVAHGLDWRPGDNVVTSNQEFPSNRIVWQSLGELGVELREAAIDRTSDPEGALFSLCDEKTRLLTISSVQYATGLRMDLERIGKFCQGHGILFCIDAIQSLGALRMDVQAIRADAVAADAHKWMMGPEGVALFYTRPALRERLRLHQYGWHMVEAAGDFDRRDWSVARGARRFECGSPNMLGIHGLNASLELLFEIGIAEVEQLILSNTRHLIEMIQRSRHLELLSSAHERHLSGIVTFRRIRTSRATGSPTSETGMIDRDGTALLRALRDRGVYAAWRGGGIRFSPHFFTPLCDLERAVEIVESI
jgi:cysteine desulfurase/selenocysteine lyase